MDRYALTQITGLPVEVVQPRWNIAPGQEAAVRVAGEVVRQRWGMLAPWRGHGGARGRGPAIALAPVAAIAGTPVLRTAVERKRCLVLADGFYAWRKRQPYWLQPPAGGRIAFAGAWGIHRDDGVASFAVITTPAVGPLADYAETTPVVIAEPDHERWLARAATAQELLAAPPSLADWRITAVATWVNDAAHDDPRCREPLGNPAQGELF